MKNVNISKIDKLKNEYIKNTSDKILKSNGQFFTPKEISIWMSKWILKSNPKTILDPSFGFGSLIHNFYNKKILKLQQLRKMQIFLN